MHSRLLQKDYTKTAEVTADLVGNKTADKIMSAALQKTSSKSTDLFPFPENKKM